MQVCFHRQHLSDHVNSRRSTAGCMVPLGRTNKATGGVKLFPTAVLSQRPPHPPPARPPPIELIHDIGGVQKKVSQNPAVLAK